MEEKDPTGRNPKDPGAKLDAGKPPVELLIEAFPRALAEVTCVNEYGAKKYSRNGWRFVPNGIDRYTGALGRHLFSEQIDGPIDPESGLHHDAQVAWNALARLELRLMEDEKCEKL